MKLDKFNLGFGIFYIGLAVLTFFTWEKYIFIFFLALWYHTDSKILLWRKDEFVFFKDKTLI